MRRRLPGSGWADAGLSSARHPWRGRAPEAWPAGLHRHELRHVIGIEAPLIDNLLTMRVDDPDRLAFTQPHRATSSSGDNVKVCHHGLVLCCPGRSCVHLVEEDDIGGGGVVKAEDFSARLAGFWTQVIGRLPQPRAVTRSDATSPNALASAGWIPAQAASAKWIPWIPLQNPAWPSRDSASH